MSPDTTTLLADWLSAHQLQFPECRWPPAEDDAHTGFYSDLIRDLFRAGFAHSPGLLREISARMMSGEKTFSLQDHRKQIFIVGHAICRERGIVANAAGGAETPEDLRRRSADCRLCHGAGITHVRLPADRRAPRLPDGTSPAYCLCPYGRSVADTHRQQSPELYRRTVDLAAHPDLAGSLACSRTQDAIRRWAEAGLVWEEDPGPCPPHRVRDAMAEGRYVAERRRALAEAASHGTPVPPPDRLRRWADVRRQLGIPDPAPSLT